MEDQSTSTASLSYGEKAVGISFNPSGNEEVNKIKRLYAEIIDNLNNTITKIQAGEYDGSEGEKIRLFKIAITQAQQAQMWAVKAITWR